MSPASVVTRRGEQFLKSQQRPGLQLRLLTRPILLSQPLVLRTPTPVPPGAESDPDFNPEVELSPSISQLKVLLPVKNVLEMRSWWPLRLPLRALRVAPNVSEAARRSPLLSLRLSFPRSWSLLTRLLGHLSRQSKLRQ